MPRKSIKEAVNELRQKIYEDDYSDYNHDFENWLSDGKEVEQIFNVKNDLFSDLYDSLTQIEVSNDYEIFIENFSYLSDAYINLNTLTNIYQSSFTFEISYNNHDLNPNENGFDFETKDWGLEGAA